jgi:hypothetical protein
VSPAALLEDEIEAFLTHAVPYDLDPNRRVQLRTAVKLTAAAYLFGALTELIGSDQVTTETVAWAVRAAIKAGLDYQRDQLAPVAIVA